MISFAWLRHSAQLTNVLFSLLRRTSAVALIALGGISAEAQTTVNFITAGAGTWTCPTGVTTVQVDAYGAGGGAGGAGANYASTGGGAGGSFIRVTSVAVTPGTVYNLNVGVGGTAGPGVRRARVRQAARAALLILAIPRREVPPERRFWLSEARVRSETMRWVPRRQIGQQRRAQRRAILAIFPVRAQPRTLPEPVAPTR